jgi:hypothetical protein
MSILWDYMLLSDRQDFVLLTDFPMHLEQYQNMATIERLSKYFFTICFVILCLDQIIGVIIPKYNNAQINIIHNLRGFLQKTNVN